MNFKRLLSFFILSSLVIFLYSCAATYPNEKLIVGDWKTIKVEKYEPPVKAPKPSNKPADTTHKSHKKSSTATAVAPDPKLEHQLERMIQTEMRSSMTVYPNKNVAKFYPGKTVKATWKMKKKGTRIVAKELNSDKKMTLDILEINDNTATVVERLPFGDIKILYMKQQK
jgi:hypothetical protein